MIRENMMTPQVRVQTILETRLNLLTLIAADPDTNLILIVTEAHDRILHHTAIGTECNRERGYTFKITPSATSVGERDTLLRIVQAQVKYRRISDKSENT